MEHLIGKTVFSALGHNLLQIFGQMTQRTHFSANCYTFLFFGQLLHFFVFRPIATSGNCTSPLINTSTILLTIALAPYCLRCRDYIIIVTMVLESASILSLLNIAVDRYFSICWPTHVFITDKKARSLCLLVLGVSLLLGIAPSCKPPLQTPFTIVTRE